jgi:hypothetical protein
MAGHAGFPLPRHVRTSGYGAPVRLGNRRQDVSDVPILLRFDVNRIRA